MTDEYTPEVRALAHWLSQEVDDEPMWSCVVIAKRLVASDWLAAHDRETRAKALEDFADRCTAASEHVGGMTTIAAFATAEAERIREDQ